MAESDHAVKAKAVIEDVFRRADKNDDGALSLKEFQEFFSDGIMTNKELEELFHVIDTSKSNNLSPSELCEYFKQFYGDFEPIYSLIDDLTTSISQAMNSTHGKHQSSGQDELSKVEKFATRFLIKEASEHVEMMGKPLESAMNHLREAAFRERPDEVPAMVDTAASNVDSVPKWRKKYESLLSTGSSAGVSVDLYAQVDRLSQLVDRLEGKIQLQSIQDEDITEGTNNVVTVVRTTLEVTESNLPAFRHSLRTYVRGTTTENGSFHICVQSCDCHFCIYEVWQDSGYLNVHYASEASKVFRKDNVDHLVRPAVIDTLDIPASWWPNDTTPSSA